MCHQQNTGGGGNTVKRIIKRKEKTAKDRSSNTHYTYSRDVSRETGDKKNPRFDEVSLRGEYFYLWSPPRFKGYAVATVRWKRWCRRSRLHLATGCGSRRRGSNRGPPITTEDAGSAGRQRDQPRTPRMRATPRARHPTLSRARTMLRERRRWRQRTPFPPLFSQNQRLATCRDTRVTGMSWDAGEILLVSSDDYIWTVEFSLEKKGEWFKIRRFF